MTKNDLALSTTDNSAMTYDAGARALAARATAMIQSRVVMAIQRPRDLDEIRVRLLAECKRPGFAEIAMYSKPVGGKPIVGMSVRFAEAALRHLRNFEVRQETIAESDEQLTIAVTAIDLETNVSSSTEVRIGKTVERRDCKDRVVISERTNSTGRAVYIVACTDDEMVTKTNALLSKARRNLILSLIPGDIVDDCKAQIRETMLKGDRDDPEAARKRLFEAFANIGVGPTQIKAYLGHDGKVSPKELGELRGIYTAIHTGETTWASVWEAKHPSDKADRAKAIDDLPDAGVPGFDPATGEVAP